MSYPYKCLIRDCGGVITEKIKILIAHKSLPDVDVCPKCKIAYNHDAQELIEGSNPDTYLHIERSGDVFTYIPKQVNKHDYNIYLFGMSRKQNFLTIQIAFGYLKVS